MDERNMIKMRPHHLLCTQGYSGKGYSDAFVDNMTRIVTTLRSDSDARVEICFDTDDLCTACPSKLAEGVCRSDEKVLRYDDGVIRLLDLKEGEYRYQDLIRRLDECLTEQELERICGDCEWYPVSACRKNILSWKLVR